MSKSISSGSICSYCSIITCKDCITNNKYCHITDNNRTICSKHIKYNNIDIYNNRFLVLFMPLSINELNIYNNYVLELKNNNIVYHNMNELFKSFYTEFFNTARSFEMHDHDDNNLWKSKLSYSSVYLFCTDELANMMVQLIPKFKRLTDINDPNSIMLNGNGGVGFQLCYQCNGYQAKVPFRRELRLPNDSLNAPQVKFSKTFCPNFYSSTLCRKANNSHLLKQKGGRIAATKSNNLLYVEDESIGLPHNLVASQSSEPVKNASLKSLSPVLINADNKSITQRRGSLNPTKRIGVCSYCSITMCELCISNNSYCHSIDNRRSLCSKHLKLSRNLEINPNRILVLSDGLTPNENTIYNDFAKELGRNYSSPFHTFELFRSFYSEFWGTAHYFEIHDSQDDNLWKSKLNFNAVYLFHTAEIAESIRNLIPKFKYITPSLDENSIFFNDNGNIVFQLCYQCNGFQANLPFRRELRLSRDSLNAPQSKLSKTFSPNFYSSTLCRKANNSHMLKQKGGRITKPKSNDLVEFENDSDHSNEDVISHESYLMLPALPVAQYHHPNEFVSPSKIYAKLPAFSHTVSNNNIFHSSNSSFKPVYSFYADLNDSYSNNEYIKKVKLNYGPSKLVHK